jgi:hypothetical protein
MIYPGCMSGSGLRGSEVLDIWDEVDEEGVQTSYRYGAAL